MQVAQFLNDHLMATGEMVFCTVPLQDVRLAVAELRRCMQNSRVVGVEIGTPTLS